MLTAVNMRPEQAYMLASAIVLASLRQHIEPFRVKGSLAPGFRPALDPITRFCTGEGEQGSRPMIRELVCRKDLTTSCS